MPGPKVAIKRSRDRRWWFTARRNLQRRSLIDDDYTGPPRRAHRAVGDRRPVVESSMIFSSSFVFINFSGYPVKERIEDPEIRVGALPAAAGFERRPPLYFRALGVRHFSVPLFS
jgi:hypothetical protein